MQPLLCWDAALGVEAWIVSDFSMNPDLMHMDFVRRGLIWNWCMSGSFSYVLPLVGLLFGILLVAFFTVVCGFLF